jgi:hypothetical protein
MPETMDASEGSTGQPLVVWAHTRLGAKITAKRTATNGSQKFFNVSMSSSPMAGATRHVKPNLKTRIFLAFMHNFY